MFWYRVKNYQYPAREVPFPAITLCADTTFDEFHLISVLLNKVRIDVSLNIKLGKGIKKKFVNKIEPF